jgi:hypothetical protein
LNHKGTKEVKMAQRGFLNYRDTAARRGTEESERRLATKTERNAKRVLNHDDTATRRGTTEKVRDSGREDAKAERNAKGF